MIRQKRMTAIMLSVLIGVCSCNVSAIASDIEPNESLMIEEEQPDEVFEEITETPEEIECSEEDYSDALELPDDEASSEDGTYADSSFENTSEENESETADLEERYVESAEEDYLEGERSFDDEYVLNAATVEKSFAGENAVEGNNNEIILDENNFPDDKFRNYVKQFDMDNNGSLSKEEIDVVTSIECSSSDISSLDGIEWFESLEYLSCYDNRLMSLDLTNNTALSELDCSDNQLTSLDMSNNTALTDLECGGNQLTSLDLSDNTALEVLTCASNQLTSLELSNNTALEVLGCPNNLLTSLDVSNNTALIALDCSTNQLTSLDVNNNKALTRIACFENQLTSLDISNNTALTSLICHNNQLTSLDLSNNTALKGLNCYNNQLTSMDISNCAALGFLSCYGNELLSIDIFNIPAIIDAYEKGDKHIYRTHIGYIYGYDEGQYDLYVDPNTEIVTHKHVYVKLPAVAPTCTTTGLTEGSKCSVCGSVIKAQTKTKALGHSFSAWKTTKKATTTATGTLTRTCTRCGKKETKTIAKLPKKAQTLTVTAKKPSLKASNLKKKKQTIAKAKVFTIKNAKGTLTFKKTDGSKNLSISRAGKITVKKKTKKGTYKLTVQVTAAGDKEYKNASKTVTVKVKVK